MIDPNQNNTNTSVRLFKIETKSTKGTRLEFYEAPTSELAHLYATDAHYKNIGELPASVVIETEIMKEK